MVGVDLGEAPRAGGSFEPAAAVGTAAAAAAVEASELSYPLISKVVLFDLLGRKGKRGVGREEGAVVGEAEKVPMNVFREGIGIDQALESLYSYHSYRFFLVVVVVLLLLLLVVIGGGGRGGKVVWLLWDDHPQDASVFDVND